MKTERWAVVTVTKLAGFALLAGLFFFLLTKSESGFMTLVDHANLLFHEAGHPIVGIFSSRLEPYGGTIGQLTFPLILMVSFWMKGQPLSMAGAAVWFFENFLNVARYMADARALKLPLVGGGDHDWNTIFQRWNVLMYDTRIAAVVKTVGWVGMMAACGWVLWRFIRDWTSGRAREAANELTFHGTPP